MKGPGASVAGLRFLSSVPSRPVHYTVPLPGLVRATRPNLLVSRPRCALSAQGPGAAQPRHSPVTGSEGRGTGQGDAGDAATGPAPPSPRRARSLSGCLGSCANKGLKAINNVHKCVIETIVNKYLCAINTSSVSWRRGIGWHRKEGGWGGAGRGGAAG